MALNVLLAATLKKPFISEKGLVKIVLAQSQEHWC